MREYASMTEGENVGDGRWSPHKRLLVPTGNIAGPDRQYRVAPKPSNTHLSLPHDLHSRGIVVDDGRPTLG